MIALLIAYGNVAALVGSAELPGGSVLGAFLGAALALAALLWARHERLGPGDLGLTRRGLARGAASGLAVALVAAVPALLILSFPPLLGRPVEYPPAADLGGQALAWHLFLFLPLAVVVPEELAFRGVLLAALRRRHGIGRAVVRSAAAFTLWHVVIVATTVERTNLGQEPAFAALGLAGAFAAVFAGGVAFAALRLVSGGLTAPIAAHWGFNAAVLLGLGARP